MFVVQLIQRARFQCRGLVAWIFVGIIAYGFACQVPVFRFALERWEADSYTLVIVPGSQGELSADEEAVAAFLQSRGSADGPAPNVNVEIDSETVGEGTRASMALSYPLNGVGADAPPIWHGPLIMENARGLVDSPARREIVARLLKGESAVWVMVESGDEEKDEAAATEIEKAFLKAESELKIPDGVLTVEEAPESPDGDSDDVLRSSIPLKIDFSFIRISRDDPAEAIFREMLLHMEDDLEDFMNEPMVFPVFGRGRALEPLIGRGINSKNVFEHASYFCGACSCEIKNQNPGVDLLIAANWEAAIAGSEVAVEKSLPPLMGIGALNDGEGTSADGETGNSFLSLWLIAGIGMVLVLGSILILRKEAR